MSLSGKIVGLCAALAATTTRATLESLGVTSGGVYAPIPAKVVRVTRATVQSVANASITAISWTAETRDDLGISAVGAGANEKVCTFTSTGVWSGQVNLRFAADADGARTVYVVLYTSGDAPKDTAALAGFKALGVADTVDVAVPFTLDVVSGDYLKVLVYHDAGGALDVGGAVGACVLTRLGT